MALPYRSAAATGNVEISAVSFSASDLRLVLDRSTLTGAVAYTAPVGADHGRLFVDLKSEGLDLDALPELSAGAGLLADADLSLSLDAAKLRVGLPGDEGIDGGSLALKLVKTGDEINLETFSLAGLGGASVEASGVMGPKERRVTPQRRRGKARRFRRAGRARGARRSQPLAGHARRRAVADQGDARSLVGRPEHRPAST